MVYTTKFNQSGKGGNATVIGAKGIAIGGKGGNGTTPGQGGIAIAPNGVAIQGKPGTTLKMLLVAAMATLLLSQAVYARGGFSSAGRGGFSSMGRSSFSTSRPSISRPAMSAKPSISRPSAATTSRRTTTTTRTRSSNNIGGGYYHPGYMYPGFGMGYGYSNGMLTGLIIGNMMHPQGTTVYSGGGYSGGNALLYPDGRVVDQNGYQVGSYSNGQFTAQQGGMVAQPAPADAVQSTPVVVQNPIQPDHTWEIVWNIIIVVIGVLIILAVAIL